MQNLSKLLNSQKVLLVKSFARKYNEDNFLLCLPQREGSGIILARVQIAPESITHSLNKLQNSLLCWVNEWLAQDF